MGRTVKTASMLITDEAGRWGNFRRALRKSDRRAFDNLIAFSRRHFSAISNSDIPEPAEAVFLSVLLELEKRLEALEDEGDAPGLPPAGKPYSPVGEDIPGHREGPG